MTDSLPNSLPNGKAARAPKRKIGDACPADGISRAVRSAPKIAPTPSSAPAIPIDNVALTSAVKDSTIPDAQKVTIAAAGSTPTAPPTVAPSTVKDITMPDAQKMAMVSASSTPISPSVMVTPSTTTDQRPGPGPETGPVVIVATMKPNPTLPAASAPETMALAIKETDASIKKKRQLVPVKSSKQSTRCEHNRQKSQCKECGSRSICPHNRIKNTCKECHGTSICPHERIRSQCK